MTVSVSVLGWTREVDVLSPKTPGRIRNARSTCGFPYLAPTKGRSKLPQFAFAQGCEYLVKRHFPRPLGGSIKLEPFSSGLFCSYGVESRTHS